LAIDAGGRARPSWRVPWLAALLALFAPGCSDGGSNEICGPGDAPADGVTASIPGSPLTIITYGDFTSSPNNDCPPPGGGPTSITIEATQTGLAPGERFSMVLCLPKPDEIDALDTEPVDLYDASLVQLVDVNARVEGDCLVRLDHEVGPSGSITFAGYCDGGGASEGYAVTFDGMALGIRRCPDGAGGFTEEGVPLYLMGTAAVEALAF
jgi:hypothetical protein